MIRFFRAVALFEGITTLSLFLIAMPVKYWLGNPLLAPPVRITHGVAFLAAFFPFSTFLNDPCLRRLELAEPSRIQ